MTKIVLRKSTINGAVEIRDANHNTVNFVTPNGDGDILDKLLSSLKEKDEITIELPERCPTCGSLIEKKEE
jgi:hypothetical protein